jgi:hypothetical protein
MGAFKIVAFVLRLWSVGTPTTAAGISRHMHLKMKNHKTQSLIF